MLLYFVLYITYVYSTISLESTATPLPSSPTSKPVTCLQLFPKFILLCVTYNWSKFHHFIFVINHGSSCKTYLQKARIIFFNLDVFHEQGKRGRQVPVLINTDEIHGIEALIKYHNDFVNPNNVYVFAVPNNKSKAYLRGNDSMHKTLDQVPNLEAPERVKSTKLPKYCSTLSQIADLTENDMRWLADHMGHSLDVHRN